jgi:hypothetical protein
MASSPVEDHPALELTALHAEFQQKRAKIASQIQDFNAEDRVKKLRKIKKKHLALWAKHLESELEEIDDAVTIFGLMSPQANQLQKALTNYGFEHGQMSQEIQWLLDGTLDAYYRAHMLDKTRDLDVESKIARFDEQDFPLHSQLLDRFQSRTELDEEIQLMHHQVIVLQGPIDIATESKRHLDEIIYEYKRFLEEASILKMIIQFQAEEHDDVQHAISLRLQMVSASGLKHRIYTHDLEEFRVVRKVIGDNGWIVDFLNKNGKSDSAAIIEHRKIVTELRELEGKLNLGSGGVFSIASSNSDSWISRRCC